MPETTFSELSTRISFGGEQLSLLELGFTPTFYQFVETVIEVKVSVSVSRETSSERTESSSTTVTTTKRHGFLGLGGSTTTPAPPVSAPATPRASNTALKARALSAQKLSRRRRPPFYRSGCSRWRKKTRARR